MERRYVLLFRISKKYALKNLYFHNNFNSTIYINIPQNQKQYHNCFWTKKVNEAACALAFFIKTSSFGEWFSVTGCNALSPSHR